LCLCFSSPTSSHTGSSGLAMSPQVHAVLLATGGLVRALADAFAPCPGNLKVEGFGMTSIVPTGFSTPDEFVGLQVSSSHDEVAPELGSRAYFAHSCNPGVYDHKEYLAFNLLGKKMRYTTDMSDLGCGCNAAFYLTNMFQNKLPSDCSDFYCDANNVCGQSCAEIDIQEGNKFSWHSTLHGKRDHGGTAKGVGGGGAGWNGPRDWRVSEYGPGASCIDTTKPFQVEVKFPADASCLLMGMEIKLSQVAISDCELDLAINNYDEMPEMSAALAAGMTPIVSYWKSNDMLWMDGEGADGKGPCATDSPDDCGNKTKFSSFSVDSIPGSLCMATLTDQQPAGKDFWHTDAMESTVTATATTTANLVASTGKGKGEIPLQAVGSLSFVAGAFSASLICAVLGYVRNRKPQQTSERQEQRTLQHSQASSQSLVSLASVTEQQQAGQPQV